MLTSYKKLGTIAVTNNKLSLNSTVINLLGRGLGDAGAEPLIKAIGEIGQVKYLNLGENNITDKLIPLILDSLILNQSLPLKSLDLGGNKLSEEGAQMLLKKLKETHTNLIELLLKGNVDIKEDTLKEIGEVLSNNKENTSAIRNTY